MAALTSFHPGATGPPRITRVPQPRSQTYKSLCKLLIWSYLVSFPFRFWPWFTKGCYSGNQKKPKMIVYKLSWQCNSCVWNYRKKKQFFVWNLRRAFERLCRTGFWIPHIKSAEKIILLFSEIYKFCHWSYEVCLGMLDKNTNLSVFFCFFLLGKLTLMKITVHMKISVVGHI